MLSTRKNNVKVILSNRYEDKLHQSSQLAKFPTKGIQLLIILGGFTFARGKYLINEKLEKGNGGKE